MSDVMESFFLFFHFYEPSCSLPGKPLLLLCPTKAPPFPPPCHLSLSDWPPALGLGQPWPVLLAWLRAPSASWDSSALPPRQWQHAGDIVFRLTLANLSSQGNSLLWPSLLLAQVVVHSAIQ